MAERKRDYPTGNPNGMSYLPGTGWRFTGPQGYRVVPGDDGTFSVVSFTAAGTTPIYGGQGLSEDAAHDMAARLAAPHRGGV